MKFWRGKKEAAKEAVQNIETVLISEAAEPAPASVNEANAETSDPSTNAEPSNVVAITSSKLSDRLAAAGLKTVTAEPSETNDGTIAPLAAAEFPGQNRACDSLRRAIGHIRRGAHVLITGQPGTGRHSAVQIILEERRRTLPRPADWLYHCDPDRGLNAFSLPHGQGAMFAREVQTAISRFEAAFQHMVVSDDYRLAVEVIEEDFRHRNDKALDDLRRRAEAQNIALVKTAEGFMLAPIHDGKVVRSEVFRALPDGLQRDVEAKIAALEGELKELIAGLAQSHLAHSDRLGDLVRETAGRAIKPQIDTVRSAFRNVDETLAAIEAGVVRAASERHVRNGYASGARYSAIRVIAAQSAHDFSETAPLITARDLTPRSLFGEIGLDAEGRTSLLPGDVMRANGGFLVIDAWRIAARPEAWSRLSAALETREIRPCVAPGAIAEAGAIPLNLCLVLIGEPRSIAKLQDIDPGFMRHFPQTVRFETSAPASSVDCEMFAKLAARVAAEGDLRPLAAGCAEGLYKDACRRAGKPETVSLDLTTLRAFLLDADHAAAAAQSAVIRRTDIEETAREQQRGKHP